LVVKHLAPQQTCQRGLFTKTNFSGKESINQRGKIEPNGNRERAGRFQRGLVHLFMSCTFQRAGLYGRVARKKQKNLPKSKQETPLTYGREPLIM